MRKRNGDTLIEVTLAVGIFSLVAIAVVSVVNSSTSGAQTALETTLAREEIDAQAEALRFIQSSYVNSDTANEDDEEEGEKKTYKELWNKIIGLAQQTNSNNPIDYSFTPQTCEALYTDNDNSSERGEIFNNAFIINTRQLGSGDIDKIIIPRNDNTKNIFTTATTYPRVIYGGANDDAGAILNEDFDERIYRAEGLYVIAVQGPETFIYSQTSKCSGLCNNAYYDFYIRSCWYESGATKPTTIGTVIRLYNPDVVQVDPPKPKDNP